MTPIMMTIDRARRGLAFAAFLGLAGASASTARGAAIRYEYGGTITSADSTTGVAPGSRYSGTFTYDPNASVANPSVLKSPAPDPTASALTFTAGGKLVYSQEMGVRLSVNQVNDFHQASAHTPGHTDLTITNLDPLGNSPFSVALKLANPGKAVYASLDPPLPLNLGDFTSASLSVGNAAKKTLYSGTLDTLKLVPILVAVTDPSPIPVPEPGALAAWLGLSGVASAWLVRGRRKA